MPPALVAEPMASELAASVRFRRGRCGFSVAWERPEDGFACLDLGSARVMLEQAEWPGTRRWRTGAPERPFGRGINPGIGGGGVAPLQEVFSGAGAEEVGVRQFLVQEPDGHLLRFQEDFCARPLGA